MRQILHRCAKTTEVVRGAIQRSQESIRAFSERSALNSQTIMKWCNRRFVREMRPMGTKQVHSSVLSLEEEAMIVAFHQHILLPLDDCFYALQSTILHLSLSSLHRCLQRVMTSVVYLILMVTSSLEKSLKSILLAISTLILQKGVQKKENYTCLSGSTGRPNLFKWSF
jgi:hypothetical protein